MAATCMEVVKYLGIFGSRHTHAMLILPYMSMPMFTMLILSLLCPHAYPVLSCPCHVKFICHVHVAMLNLLVMCMSSMSAMGSMDAP